MGNSGSGGHHSYKTAPQAQQYVQSLPRDGRGRGSSTAAAQKYYNGGFKVLPERVPGQKLRLTDNGNLLQNGGTLSGRRLGAVDQSPSDHDLALLLKRRSDIAHGSSKTDDEYDGDPRNHRFERDGTLSKKYYSNPDLLHSHGIVSGNPTGIKRDNAKNKKAMKKTKAPAPSPPHHQAYSEDGTHNDSYFPASGSAPGPPQKDKKRPFANFLRASPKKNNQDTGGSKNKPSKPSKAQDVEDAEDGRLPPPTPYATSPVDINAEVTSARTDSRDKSVTYVLERRETHSSSTNVLNISKVQNLPGVALSTNYNQNGPGNIVAHQNPERWHFKRGQSPEAPHQPPFRTPGTGNGAYRQQRQQQANLSDGSIQAGSIDRAEFRGRAFEMQKRVRSMDSLAHSSDDRDIHLGRHNSPSHSPFRDRPARELLESLGGANGHSRPSPLTRKTSHSSSLHTDATGDRTSPPMNVRHKQQTAAGSSQIHHLLQGNGPVPATRSHLSPRPDSNNQKAFYYGQPDDERQFAGSLDRRRLVPDNSRVHHQREPSGSDAFGDDHVTRTGRDQKRRQRVDPQGEDDDVVAKLKQFNTNFNSDHHQNPGPPWDKSTRQMSKEILTTEMRDNDNSAASKTGKTYRDKTISADHSLQGLLFEDGDRAVDLITRHPKPIGPKRHGLAPEDEDQGQMSSEDEMDINMQLRPTLPKRPPIMPRFSPTQVWRSFNLESDNGATTAADRGSDRSSDTDEADVFEERILRIARPIAPPRSSHEKSADSGISPGAVSPVPPLYDFDAVMTSPEKALRAARPAVRKPFQYLLTSPPQPISPLNSKGAATGVGLSSAMGPILSIASGGPTRPTHLQLQQQNESPKTDKRRQWTPEEDLASDFDAGSADHAIPEPVWKPSGPEMVSTQPKLTSRKGMFASSRLDADNSDETEEAAIKPSRKYKGQKQTGSSGDTNANSSQTYNSVRKLKRSLSGVLQSQVRTKTGNEERHTNLDDNWSLSRSLPNSLHNGHDGDRPGSRQQNKEVRPATNSAGGQPVIRSQSRLPRSESGPIYVGRKHQAGGQAERHSFTDLEGIAYDNDQSPEGPGGSASGIRYNRNGHIMYLPKYEAMEIISENRERNGDGRKAYSDLGMGTKAQAEVDRRNFPFKKPKKFTYQSTVRQLERKQLEQKLSQEVALKEHQRAREMDLVNRVEEEFQKKRDREKADIRDQLRILSMESLQDDVNYSASSYHPHRSNTRSLPREYPIYDDGGGPDSVPVRGTHSGPDKNEWGHLSLPPMVIPPEDYDMTLPRDPKVKTGGGGGPSSKMNSSDRKALSSSRSSNGKGDPTTGGGGSPGFFGGIGKWMRRQQRLEKHNDHNPSRQEPEGAPSSFGPNIMQSEGNNSPSTANGHFQVQPPLANVLNNNRTSVITGAKFSSGRKPDDQSYAKPVSPQQRKTIYTHLAEVVEKEENRQKARNQGGARDARTSVWITQDRPSYSSNTNAKPGRSDPENVKRGPDFYETSYNNLDRESTERGKSNTSDLDNSSSQYTRSSKENYDRHFESYNSLRDWNAGQRHSIAVDTSREQWSTAMAPRPQGYEDTRRNAGNNTSSSNKLPTNNSGHLIDRSPWSQGIVRQDSYQETVEGGNNYRRRYAAEPQSLNPQQRSLSFNHIWDGGLANGHPQEPSNARSAFPSVQPFSPSKAYRPVAFHSSQYELSK